MNKLKRIYSTKNTKSAGKTLIVCIYCGKMTTDKTEMEMHKCIIEGQ